MERRCGLAPPPREHINSVLCSPFPLDFLVFFVEKLVEMMRSTEVDFGRSPAPLPPQVAFTSSERQSFSVRVRVCVLLRLAYCLNKRRFLCSLSFLSMGSSFFFAFLLNIHRDSTCGKEKKRREKAKTKRSRFACRAFSVLYHGRLLVFLFLIPWVYSTRCVSRPLPSLFSFFFFWCFHAPLRNGSGYVILSVEVGK